MDNCKNFKLIAHALIKIDGKYLIIRRTKIKRGKIHYQNIGIFQEEWLKKVKCQKMLLLEKQKKRLNLDITIGPILHEDSNYDKEKGTVFTRIVYQAELLEGQDESDIILQKDEHSEYMLVSDISSIDKIVDYLEDTINHANIYNLGFKYLRKD